MVEDDSKNSTIHSSYDSTMSIRERISLCQLFRSKKVHWSTYLLVILFGMGSWIAINGIWVELPILVDFAPESWDLPSYLAVIIQLANIGPLVYSLGSQYLPRYVTEKCTVILIIIIGATSCLLLAMFWDKTTYVGGVEHCVALIVLTVCVGIVDCTSSVVFLTFMSSFEPVYMSALYVGEAMSGLLPGLVALIQGIESNTQCSNSSEPLNITSASNPQLENSGLRFGPSVFFIFLSLMMCLCGVSFIALNYLAVRREVLSSKKERKHTVYCAISCDGNIENDSTPVLSRVYTDPEEDDLTINYLNSKKDSLSQKEMIYLLCIQGWINCLSNGVLPSIQSYACEPYGKEAYHLVAILSQVTSTCTCLASIWIPTKSSILVSIYTVFFTAISAFIIVVASLSPTPPMYKEAVGALLVVFVSIIAAALANYTKLSVSTIMCGKGRRALFWCGISTQIGSFIGAMTMFPLVNVLKLFHQTNPC